MLKQPMDALFQYQRVDDAGTPQAPTPTVGVRTIPTAQGLIVLDAQTANGERTQVLIADSHVAFWCPIWQ